MIHREVFRMTQNLIQSDVKIMRAYYDEALKAQGIPAKYQYPHMADTNTQGESVIDSYSIPEDVFIFFEGAPKLKTFKRYGWVVEKSDDLPFLIHCSFNLKHLQKDCLFEIAGQHADLPSRKFRVTELTTDIQCPDHIVAQVIPVYNDGYASRYDKVHPGFLELSQTVRLPYNLWATLSVGNFNNSRYGIDFNLIHHFNDERFSVEGRIGYTGTGYWEGFTMHYGTKMRTTWSLGGSFYWPRYNVELNARMEQYLLQEKAVRVEAIRHFRYASIGFYAMKAKNVKANGGFRFQIALPPYRYKRKGYIPRITPSNNMGMSYNAGNEQYYYKTYRPAPDDNIMKNNSFNPYFVKSELLNF